MNKFVKILLALSLLASVSAPVFASDWDVAGKVLTGIEGLRVISGGEVDVIGALTGINNKNYGRRHSYRKSYRYQETHVCNDHCEREWVPYYVWEEKWVPAHRAYDPYRRRTIFAAGHYVRYKVENGGRWVYRCPHRNYSYQRY